MEDRTRVTNGMIKDIIGVDCNGCQHKDVCRFCENAETFIRDIKGAYPTGGSAPFVLMVSCTHNSKLTLTRSGDWSMGVRDITNSTMLKDDNNGGGESVTTTNANEKTSAPTGLSRGNHTDRQSLKKKGQLIQRILKRILIL